MIILDTHIWVWWAHGSESLSDAQVQTIQASERDGIGVSTISVWEIAKLVEYGRLDVSCPLREWFEKALTYPGVRLVEMTPQIAIESTRLPGDFHSDPADQIIVATARVHDSPLVTADRRILAYPHVSTVP